MQPIPAYKLQYPVNNGQGNDCQHQFIQTEAGQFSANLPVHDESGSPPAIIAAAASHRASAEMKSKRIASKTNSMPCQVFLNRLSVGVHVSHRGRDKVFPGRFPTRSLQPRTCAYQFPVRDLLTRKTLNSRRLSLGLMRNRKRLSWCWRESPLHALAAGRVYTGRSAF